MDTRTYSTTEASNDGILYYSQLNDIVLIIIHTEADKFDNFSPLVFTYELLLCHFEAKGMIKKRGGILMYLSQNNLN